LILILVLVLAWTPCPRAVAEPKQLSFSDYVLRGFEHEREGRYPAAVEDYTAALVLNEESPTPYVRRAFCAARLGQLERAAVDLREAGLLSPSSMTDYTTMAWLLATCPIKSVRDGTRAVAYAQKAHREGETDETFDILAAAYAEMGNFQMARNLLLEAKKKFPDSARMNLIDQRLALYNEKKPFRDQWLPEDEERRLQNSVEFPK
jgi:tetratricopeptide (TPR) repeat protein